MTVCLLNDHIVLRVLAKPEGIVHTDFSPKSRSMRHRRPEKREGQSSASPVFIVGHGGRQKTLSTEKFIGLLEDKSEFVSVL